MARHISVYQDGSNFYHVEHGHIATAPRRVWDIYEHDSMEAGRVCYMWFLGWCEEQGFDPEFI